MYTWNAKVRTVMSDDFGSSSGRKSSPGFRALLWILLIISGLVFVVPFLFSLFFGVLMLPFVFLRYIIKFAPVVFIVVVVLLVATK